MKRLEKLINLVRPYYSSVDPAHDWAHIERVVKNANDLAQGEKVHLPILLAASYCHDLINLPKNHPERSQASTLTAKEAAPLLHTAAFTNEEVNFIQKIIIEHSYSRGKQPSSLEAAILQDADRLDALGSIGILRCAAVNTKIGSVFYDPNDPLAEYRELNDKAFMLDHYYVKLFKLPELMNTAKAKSEAHKRVTFMKKFIHELITETGL